MRKSSRALCARALYATVLLAAGSHLFAQSQPTKPPRPAVSRADEMLERGDRDEQLVWLRIRRAIVEMQAAPAGKPN